jgi:hypothetical protein
MKTVDSEKLKSEEINSEPKRIYSNKIKETYEDFLPELKSSKILIVSDSILDSAQFEITEFDEYE